MPNISASSKDIPQWNKRFFSYFEVLFAFANANLHDVGVLVVAHAVDLEVFRLIHNWAHTEEFYVAEDWFGMNDLDLQSPTNPSELIILFRFLPSSISPYFFDFCIPNSTLYFNFQTRKFFIKVLVRNQSILNVRTSTSEDKGYNLKRDGWITSFTDVKNQSMRDDGVPWRSTRENRPDFFNTLFAALTDNDDIILDWQCGVRLFFYILSLMSFIFFTFNL